jgi:hypothetical protein
MHSVLRFRLLAAFALGLVGAAACAQDFSADIVNLSAASNTFHTRIFSTKGKLRFQGEDKAGRTNSIMIVNLAAGTSIVLIPQQKQYIDSKQPQIPGQGVTFFQANDVETACGDWQKMAQSEESEKPEKSEKREEKEKSRCRNVGHETVNGRDTVKYEDTSSKEAGAIWIDAKLHFPVKWKNAVGAGELRNIKEEAQAAELFQIPPGFTKRSFDTKTKTKADK